MDELFIDGHAFKNGIEADDIAFAWEHFVTKQYRKAPNERLSKKAKFKGGGG